MLFLRLFQNQLFDYLSAYLPTCSSSDPQDPHCQIQPTMAQKQMEEIAPVLRFIRGFLAIYTMPTTNIGFMLYLALLRI